MTLHPKGLHSPDQRPVKLLILAPYLDDTDVGEAYCAYRWVQALSEQADVTLLTMNRPNWSAKNKILPGVRCLTVDEPRWARRFERLNAMGKLSYGPFSRWARRQIQALLDGGEFFDIAHQFSPFAMRHTSPLRFFKIPYVLGPKAGSLSTPDPLRADQGSDPFYMRLRGLDAVRLKCDPAIRATYQKAALTLGAAPYVEAALGGLVSGRFETESELGIDGLPLIEPHQIRKTSGDPVRLLHIGRGVRSKGLRDTIRALALLPADRNVHLDVAGKGSEIGYCQILAAQLGVSHRITFHGQISRQAVDTLYRAADIFVFPSFREPSGSVIYEAMSNGLPIIAANCGGPGHVVREKTGMLIEPQEPEAFAKAIKTALVTLLDDPLLRQSMGQAARQFMAEHALWSKKATKMMTRYRVILQTNSETQETIHATQTTA